MGLRLLRSVLPWFGSRDGESYNHLFLLKELSAVKIIFQIKNFILYHIIKSNFFLSESYDFDNY